MRNTDDGLAQYIIDNDLTEETVDLTTEPFVWEDKARIALNDQVAAAEMHQYLTGYEHLISAFAPVLDANGKVAAVVGVDISDEQLLSMHNTMNILTPLQVLGVLTIGVCSLLNVFMYNTADKRLSIEVEKGDIDPLTNIYNRRFFDKHMEQLVQSLSHSGRQLGLLMIDIDFFKQYNDTYGHLAGDECLQLVAKGLQEGIRHEGDFITRYGGEEFIAVLPDTDEAGACDIANRLQRNIRELNIPHKASTVSDRVTVSIGIVSVKVEEGANWKDYVKCADDLLYIAKQNGRDQCAR
jgi:diguanylate cyclase (GGDEF) domain